MTNILVLSCSSVLIQLLNTLAPTSASRADKGSSNRKISASSYTALLWDREDGFVGDVRRISVKVLAVNMSINTVEPQSQSQSASVSDAIKHTELSRLFVSVLQRD